MELVKKRARRFVIAIAGGAVLIAGIILVPYPGPGWLTIFAGLAILATEFFWARRLLDEARMFYGRWQKWLRRQHIAVRALFIVMTGIIVVMTMWLLNGFGIIAGILGLHEIWLRSPLLW